MTRSRSLVDAIRFKAGVVVVLNDDFEHGRRTNSVFKEKVVSDRGEDGYAQKLMLTSVMNNEGAKMMVG